MAWSIAAMLALLLPPRWHTRTFVLGPALTVGLATALSLPTAPLPLVAVWLTLVGGLSASG